MHLNFSYDSLKLMAVGDTKIAGYDRCTSALLPTKKVFDTIGHLQPPKYTPSASIYPTKKDGNHLKYHYTTDLNAKGTRLNKDGHFTTCEACFFIRMFLTNTLLLIE
jgi:hypothetical protein